MDDRRRMHIDAIREVDEDGLGWREVEPESAYDNLLASLEPEVRDAVVHGLEELSAYSMNGKPFYRINYPEGHQG